MSEFHPDILTPVLMVDGHNLLNRVYHVPAFQSLTNEDGVHTGVVFGFMQTVLSLIREYHDYFLAVIWDGGVAPWRRAIHPGYKARDRKPHYHLVRYEIPKLIDAMLDSMGIHHVMVPDTEADDVIAMVSRHSQRSLIYSNDKDFWQLIRPGHRVLRPSGGSVTLVDEYTLGPLIKQDMTPQEFRIYLAMMGDASDKVPGAKGVGTKTAVELIRCLRSGEWGPEYKLEEVLDPRAPVEALRPLYEISLETTRVKRKGTRGWANLYKHWDEFEQSLQLIDLWCSDLLASQEFKQAVGGLMVEREFDREWFDVLMDRWEFSHDRDHVQADCEERVQSLEVA